MVTCIFKKCYKEVIQVLKAGLCPREGNNPDTDVQKVVRLFWKPASLMLLYSDSPGPRLHVTQELASGNSLDFSIEYFLLLRKLVVDKAFAVFVPAVLFS